MTNETLPKRPCSAALALVSETVCNDTSPGSPKRRTFKLTTIRSVRREMASIYNEARNGRMSLDQACRFIYILSSLAKTIEASEVEDRIAALEAAAKKLGDT